MTDRVLALVGAGVVRNAALLRPRLDPSWSIVPFDPALERPTADLRRAEAAVGMPRAIDWRTETPDLRLLQLPGAGTDGLAPELLTDGCGVCNVYEHEASVAEYVFGCLFRMPLDWLGDVIAAHRRGRWRHFDRIGEPPRPSISGRTLGLIGFGHIGQRCADIALALNMAVAVHSRSRPSSFEHYSGRGVVWLNDPASVAAVADALVVACSLTDRTRGLIDAAVLARMRTHAILVNVARAPVVDERALYDALANRKIGGAVLDVWYRYPDAPDATVTGSTLPFHELQTVIVTPHLAANTEDTVFRRWNAIADNLERYRRGEPLANVVRPPSDRSE